MTIEIKSAAKIVEAGTAQFTETFAPIPRQLDESRTASDDQRSSDQVLPLGSSVFAPGLATPLGR